MNSVEFIDNAGGSVANENGTATANNNETGQPVQTRTNIFEEIASLLDHELPECRLNLIDNHANLEQVAEYCEVNYFQSKNKRAALEENKDYMTQSLASVAYQINTLAYNFSQLLDLQSNQLQNMEANLSYIGQVIRIHKEKVARREIGVLTASKTVGRQHKIVSLPNPEKLVKYVRKPIDFTALDKIGHGCKSDRVDGVPLSGTGTMKSTHHKQRGTSQSGGMTTATSASGPAPTTKPPTPPQTGGGSGTSSTSISSGSGMKIVGTGTLGKSSREYRTPPAVAPPQVPSHYAPNYPKKPGYSTLPLATMAASVTTQQQQQYGQLNAQQNDIYKSTRLANQSSNLNSLLTLNEQLPPPAQQLQTHSPPLPSPPPPPPQLTAATHDSALETDHHHFMGRSSASRLAAIVPQDADLPGWVPKNFIEKVIAIYDYYADKEDELSFQESAVIYVLKKNDDGWWEGVMDGITGLFPGNYVEPCV